MARPKPLDPKCSVKECEGQKVARGLCDKHYRRLKDYGDVEFTKRPADWGKREQHPLYGTWTWMHRSTKNGRAKEWDDFWTFVRDVVQRPENHLASRPDASKPFGPANFFWREVVFVKASDESGKEGRARYMREYRVLHPERVRGYEIKKNYGITLQDYQDLALKQGYVCAICGQPETDIDHNSGEPRNLAIDHCHSTNEVRGLLCGACNKGLGNFKDNARTLANAIEYLREKDTNSPSQADCASKEARNAWDHP